MRYGRLTGHLTRLAFVNPALLLPMAGAAWRFRARGWYARWPFLPVPPADYIAWRLHTAYGRDDALPPARELGRYLRWTRRIRQ